MYNNFFYSVIEGDVIKQVDQATGQATAIGYTNASYNQLLEIAEGYKKKLEEAGLIKKELTQKELIEKQTELLEKMTDRLENLEKKFKDLGGKK